MMISLDQMRMLEKKKARRSEPAGLSKLGALGCSDLNLSTAIAHARMARPINSDELNLAHVVAIGEHERTFTTGGGQCQHFCRR